MERKPRRVRDPQDGDCSHELIINVITQKCEILSEMKNMHGCGKSYMNVSPSSSLSGPSMHCVTSAVPVPWVTCWEIGAAGSAASVCA